MNRVVAFLSVMLATIPCEELSAQGDGYDLVFSGLPEKRVMVGPEALSEENLTSDQRQEFRLVVVRDQAGRYFWLSRDMRELIRSDNLGIFTVFHAVDGIGYVKMVRRPSEAGFAVDLALAAGGGGDAYSYVEHFSTQFASATYYGTSELRGDLPR